MKEVSNILYEFAKIIKWTALYGSKEESKKNYEAMICMAELMRNDGNEIDIDAYEDTRGFYWVRYIDINGERCFDQKDCIVICVNGKYEGKKFASSHKLNQEIVKNIFKKYFEECIS